jgi:hypothetical protein
MVTPGLLVDHTRGLPGRAWRTLVTLAARVVALVQLGPFQLQFQ